MVKIRQNSKKFKGEEVINSTNKKINTHTLRTKKRKQKQYGNYEIELL